MSNSRLRCRRSPRRRRRRLAAAAAARRLHRPGQGARQSPGLHRGRARAQGSARPRAAGRPARSRQDHAGADRRARAWRQLPRHLRPGDRQGRRPRRAAHQSRAARRAVHRRDPPSRRRRSRKSSIRRWRISSSTSSSAKGPAARSVKIELAPFTLVGATTRAGLLTNPLRDRFGIPVRLDFYSDKELEEIVSRGARVLGIAMSADGANEIARRARGTPRIAGRLLRRVRDFASVAGAKSIDRKAADKALGELEVDADGLDAMDRRYLDDDCAQLRRRPGRRRYDRRRAVGAARRHRGHHRAVPDPAGLRAAHAARPPAHRPRFQTSRPAEPTRDPGQFGLFANGESDE